MSGLQEACVRSPKLAIFFVVALLALPTFAQTPNFSKTVKEFVRVQSARVVLTHVRVIDGTGVAAVEDQNIVIEGDKIVAVEKGSDVASAEGTTVLDLHGYSVMPGIVGMHNHFFYIAHHVAITSTLPVFEGDGSGRRPPVRQQALDAMSPEAREDFFLLRQRPASRPAPKVDPAMLFKRDMELERAFAAAGGLLLAGPDPTGDGDVLPGFGDQREMELLVEAGFSAVEAIRIATLNGAKYLGRDNQIGSVAKGKNADLVVIKGDPSKNISDVENVEIVFKDGVGYDSSKLLESVKGRYGQY